jgi:hypothetical protein
MLTSRLDVSILSAHYCIELMFKTKALMFYGSCLTTEKRKVMELELRV